MNKTIGVGLLAALLTATVAAAPSAAGAVPTDTTALRNAVNSQAIGVHLDALQAIADANGGTRASGTPGYDASVDYVASRCARPATRVDRPAVHVPDFFSELGARARSSARARRPRHVHARRRLRHHGVLRLR